MYDLFGGQICGVDALWGENLIVLYYEMDFIIMYVCIGNAGAYLSIRVYVWLVLLEMIVLFFMCQSCNICVVNLDHHCPFVNNCVGRGNRRVFVLFTLFASMVGPEPNSYFVA